MKKYDNIVVGSGISGLTLALILGLNGRKVLLLEKAPQIGGSLARFWRKGLPFDTGFHFTGAFSEGGLLCDMLKVLGLEEEIKPIFLKKEGAMRFVFKEEGEVYDLPYGLDNLIAKLKEYFPEEETAITKCFDMMERVCDNTVAMDLRKISLSPQPLDEDFVSAEDVLNGLTQNKSLKTVLSAYSMCYGTRPSEASFANHSRVSFGLYQSVARVKDGGDAFIRAFKKRFQNMDIDIRTSTSITRCEDVQNDSVGRFILNDEEAVTCSDCILTIHPKEILKILPKESLSKAFISRVTSYEESYGFFLAYGAVCQEKGENDHDPSILSLLPHRDINKLLDPKLADGTILVIMKSTEEIGGKLYSMINAFEPSFPIHQERWADSTIGKRSADYYEYKEKRIKAITKRILDAYPEYSDSLEIMGGATTLTFRDYLHSYDGSAYGIKQKVGQYNLLGKLPVCNIYAAGQSSVLPGIVGAMTSSFLIGRSIVGKEEYCDFIKRRLNS